MNIKDTIHPAIYDYLQQMEIGDEKSLTEYLYPNLSALPEPALLKSIDAAVALVREAIVHKQDILVWGDYDVDGITAASVLIVFFKRIGVQVHYHIPDRLTEGYGLNQKKIREYSQILSKNKLLITVDCGISDGEEIKEAQRRGFKVIVTDHHEVPADKIPADAVINPKQSDCTFPDKNLSGVGVAFYFIAALKKSIANIVDNTILNDLNLKYFLAYVAVGTIADVMPLKGVNRLLVKGGFEVIAQSPVPGLDSLLTELGIVKQNLRGEDIAYRVAPSINAAGRLGKPMVPLELFIGEAGSTANKTATQLVKLNEKRKKLSRINLEKALSSTSISLIEHNKCIVMAGDFHAGILGITAARLAELYHVPALICCDDYNDRSVLKGSGRAPEGINLHAALIDSSNLLIGFGGHEAAAGFSLHRDDLQAFKDSFSIAVRSQLKDCKNRALPATKNCSSLHLPASEALDPFLLRSLPLLEPVGEGNPSPVFFDDEARIVSLKLFGQRREHGRGQIRGRYKNISFIGFNKGELLANIKIGEPVRLEYTHTMDGYQGKTIWKIRLKNVWQ